MAATDDFRNEGGIEHPATNAESVTPDDNNDLTKVTRSVYIGGAGDMKVDMADGGTVTFKSIPSGTILPIRVSRVYSTDTSASEIIGLS